MAVLNNKYAGLSELDFNKLDAKIENKYGANRGSSLASQPNREWLEQSYNVITQMLEKAPLDDIYADNHELNSELFDIYNEIDPNDLPGETALEKGHSAYILRKQAEQQPEVNRNSSKSIAQKMKEMLDDFNEMQEEMQPGGEKGGEGQGGYENFIKANNTPHIPIRAEKVLDALARVSLMKTFSQGKKKRVNEPGNHYEHKPMKSVSDIYRLPVHRSIVDPLFNLKVIKKSYEVINSFKLVDTKQSILLRFDESGSMFSDAKMQMCYAIVMHYCKKVLKGQIDYLFVGTFVEEISPLVKVDASNASTFVYDFVKMMTGGGGTYIEDCLDEDFVQIETRKLKLADKRSFLLKEDVRLEVVYVNDGQDDVERHATYSRKVNILTLGKYNHDFEGICKRSGGHYENLDI